MKLSKHTEREKGISSLVVLAVIWGMMPLVPRFLSTAFDLFQQIYLRMFVGFVVLFIIFHKSISVKKLLSLPLKETSRVFLRSFIYYCLGVGFFTIAVLTTKVSNVSFIGAIPMTAILGFIILREKITVQKILLVLLSACGVLIVSVKDFTQLSFGLGEIFALLSAFFLSLGLIARKWETKFLNDYEVAVLMLFFATVQTFLISIFTGEGLPLTGWTPSIILVLIFAGLLNSGSSFFMNYGFARVDAVLAGNITSMSLLFATTFAFLVFREYPIPREIFGGGLILLSAILLHQIERKQL